MEPTRRLCFFAILVVLFSFANFFLCSATAALAQNGPADNSGNLAATEDHQKAFPPTLYPKHGTRELPNLAELRSALRERSFEDLAVPGGLGSGTIYKQGELQATFEGTLRTQMIVYPEGMALPNNFLFTTATNRTANTVEVVGIFFGTGPESIGLFDWSCLPDWPCPNGETEPSWQWTYPVSEKPCYVVTEDDLFLNLRLNWFTYQNESKSGKAEGAKPPLWQNTVKFWNYCNEVWDLVYMHKFRADEKDCSVDNSCAWWGPIIETFFDSPQPLIRPLGFRNATLTHDREKSDLGPDETNFVFPAIPWQTLYLHPNDSWIVGP